jgi:hypothetical protein
MSHAPQGLNIQTNSILRSAALHAKQEVRTAKLHIDAGHTCGPWMKDARGDLSVSRYHLKRPVRSLSRRSNLAHQRQHHAMVETKPDLFDQTGSRNVSPRFYTAQHISHFRRTWLPLRANHDAQPVLWPID